MRKLELLGALLFFGAWGAACSEDAPGIDGVDGGVAADAQPADALARDATGAEADASPPMDSGLIDAESRDRDLPDSDSADTGSEADAAEADAGAPVDGGPPVDGGFPENTYYVAPLSSSCNPQNPGLGTLADPWTNPYYALTQGGLLPGDTLQLRGGLYRNVYDGYMFDGTQEDAWNGCDDDLVLSGNFDGSHTVLPLQIAGTPGLEIIIENYPGEVVVIDGTNERMAAASWTACAGSVFQTSDFNFGSARTPQLWVDPADNDDPGTRLVWNSDNSACPALLPGEFAYDSNRNLYVRLADDSDPSGHDVRASCQGGDCATHPIHADQGAEYITVRKNPAGGDFYVKYGYYIGYITGDAHHLTFDGLRWVAGGGRDYGYCFRVTDGDFVTLKNGLCRETMGEGIGLYGGGPQDGMQITNNVVENMRIFDTGRGWVDGGGNGTSLGMGIIIKNCSECVARGNVISGSYRSGIQVNYSNNGCPVATCSSGNVLIEQNEVWDFCRFRQGSEPNAGQGDCGGILVRAAQGNGVIDGAIIRNNMVRGDLSIPFTNNAGPSGIYTDGPIAGARIINNSLFEVPGACINVRPNPNPVVIVGNAMSGCSASGGGCNGFPCALQTNASVPPITSYNTYWTASGSDIVVRQNGGASVVRDDVTGFEPTAVQFDPEFVSGTDLHLQAGSNLIDAMPCTDAPMTDFDDTTRPRGPLCDVGAHEHL